MIRLNSGYGKVLGLAISVMFLAACGKGFHGSAGSGAGGSSASTSTSSTATSAQDVLTAAQSSISSTMANAGTSVDSLQAALNSLSQTLSQVQNINVSNSSASVLQSQQQLIQEIDTDEAQLNTELLAAEGTSPGTTTTGTTPTITIKATAMGCTPLTTSGPGACKMSFQLSSALTYAYSFSWQTNDILFGQAPPPGDPPYGKPGVDYKSSSGTLTFQPGTTSQTISVPVLANASFLIPYLYTNCIYDGMTRNCAADFAPPTTTP